MRYAVIIGMLLIAIPLILRINAPEPFPDAMSYEQLRTSTLKGYDSLAAKPYTATISDRIYSLVNPQLILITLAGITLVCLSLYYSDEIFILLLAVSPAFITTYTTVSGAAPALMLMSLATLLVSRRQYWAVIAIPVCFAFSFNLGILATIVIIVAAIIANLPFIALGASFFALISGTTAAFISNTLDFGFTSVSFSSILGIFGSSNGITIFLAFLAIIGFIMNYERRTEQLLSILIIPCSLFFEHGLIIIAAYLAYYASKALRYLWERDWHFEELKSITLVLITCGLLFTTIIVEKNRLYVDEDRVQVTRFITAAYAKGTPIAADNDLAPVLRYHGYPAATVIISDQGRVTSTLQENGFRILATKQPIGADLNVAYTSIYTVYEMPLLV